VDSEDERYMMLVLRSQFCHVPPARRTPLAVFIGLVIVLVPMVLG